MQITAELKEAWATAEQQPPLSRIKGLTHQQVHKHTRLLPKSLHRELSTKSR